MDGGFEGTARFQVISRLGAGGMGTVYHVYDRERNTRVALKTVGLADGQALLRFKREFRALRDIHHPNLISLGELFEADGLWFYTMELVEGVDFASYVRAAGPAAPDAPTEAYVAPAASAPKLSAEDRGRPPVSPTTGGFDELRLRAALAQLAQGLAALHAANKVHRDIKPANILVESNGRVVILDFGLVTEVSGGVQATDVGAVGTIAYMAPEQASGRPVDARADWYSVGTLLFEAMTGSLPFPGHSLATVARKLTEEAPDPRAIVPHLPDDLVALCRDLLRMEPTARPSERQIFERLHVERESGWELSHSMRATVWGRRHFVGREAELRILAESFERALSGRGANLVFAGEVGIGKTLLVRRFLQTLTEARDDVLVLTGRCLQRESVPFKALDDVVDALSSHLHRLDSSVVESMLPPGADVLPRAFPVLRRVAAFARRPRIDVRDPKEQRARVFVAFRELLARVARRRPTVIWIDDLQWLDEDSGALLGELLRPPAAAPWLFVATERIERKDEEHASRLRAVVRDAVIEVHEVPRLREAEAKELTSRLLEGRSLPESWSRKIAKESRGHPLFVDELTQYVALVGPDATAHLDLDHAVRARIAVLDDASLGLLQLVAVAEGPIVRRVVAHASGMQAEDFTRRCTALEALRLLRAAGALETDAVEPYHMRLASTVLASVRDRRELHARLAGAMEGLPGSDPVDLARHWALAGDGRRSAEWYATAATNAISSLAFDRAAALLRRSLELEPEDGPGLEDRKIRLAHALANAGRGLAAGETYLEAAATAPAGVALDLRRRASEQLMLSGHVERGVASFEQVLREVGIWYPRSILLAALSIVWSNVVLFFLRYEFRARDESLLDPAERLRVDVCNSVYLCLVHTDPIRGVDFQERALIRALRLGEPGRVAKLLAMHAAQIATQNGRRWDESRALIARGHALATSSKSAEARGICIYGDGMAHYVRGHWGEGLALMSKAERVFREECVDAPAELRTLQAVIIHSLWEAGAWRELRERLRRAVKEAEERGDLFTEATFRAGHMLHVDYLYGDADAGLEAAERSIRSWSGTGFGVQKWLHTMFDAECRDYVGRLGEGYDRIRAAERAARRSLLNRLQLMRAGLHRERGLRAVSAAIARPAEREALLGAALADARRLEREDAEWARATGLLVRASVFGVRGDVERALPDLVAAGDSFERIGMRGWLASTRWAQGLLVGGDEGRALVDGARSYMLEQEVVCPERVAATLVPLLFVLEREA